MLTIHIRVNDEHGQPTPVRFLIQDSEGYISIPSGYRDFMPGTGEIALPAGVPLRLNVTKGIEYRPIDKTLTLKPGQMAIRLQLERWIDFKQFGWMSSTIECDDRTPHDAGLEGAADGLDCVNVLIHQSSNGTVHNMAAFSGTTECIRVSTTKVFVNSSNRHHQLGTVALLACHRPIHPLYVDGVHVPDDWLLTDWCDQCHRKNGLTVGLAPSLRVPTEVSLVLVAALLGRIDVLQFFGVNDPTTLDLWYQLLNLGLMITLVPASISQGVIVAQIPDSSDYLTWIEAVRAGSYFITNGPIFLDDSTCQSLNEFASLERVVDGMVVETVIPHCHNGMWEARLVKPVTMPCHWSAMRVWSEYERHRAHSAITIHDPNHRVEIDATPMIDCINRTKRWAIEQGRFENPKRREEMLQLCDEALQVLADRT